MRRCNCALAVALFVALPGCSPDDTMRATRDAAAAGGWQLVAITGPGAVLVQRTEAGTEEFRITCHPDRPAFSVTVGTFRRVASEDRLTIGAGESLLALALDLGSGLPADAPVSASGPPDPAFLRGFLAGQDVGASYGAQNWGPVAGVPRELTARFAEACRIGPPQG